MASCVYQCANENILTFGQTINMKLEVWRAAGRQAVWQFYKILYIGTLMNVFVR